QPRLPVELEREIFELAAEVRPLEVSSLLLVARRVKIWTEPILYRVFIICMVHAQEGSRLRMSVDKFLRLLDSRPASFFRDHTRHLFCHAGMDLQTEAILTKCSGVENLCLLSNDIDRHFPAIVTIGPRRLEIAFLFLFDPTHQMFRRVTHLCLNHGVRPGSEWVAWTGLAALPCLTHLGFCATSSSTVLQGALAHCPHLLVLVVLWPAIPHIQDLNAAVAHDKRFVQLAIDNYADNWEAGATGGEDHWSRAEAILHERQSRQSTAKGNYHQYVSRCSIGGRSKIANFKAT
ncbi:hypothetical protein C8R43DRAFT_1197718, partial [Mycena crocata]